jgi:hypothetical protein
MIPGLSELLRHPDPVFRRQGIELAESLAAKPELHPQIREAQQGASGLLTGVVTALMLRLPGSALAITAERPLLLKLPFNLPELALLAARPRQTCLHIVEADHLDPATVRLPGHLTGLTLYYLSTTALLEAVVAAELPLLTELNLDQLMDGVDLSGLCRLTTVRSLTVQSSPGVCLGALPPDLSSLRLERVGLTARVLEHASGLSDLSLVDCNVDDGIRLPQPGALRRIKLEGLALTVLPVGLLTQPDLASLSLRRNELSALPESIWTMSGVQELQLSGNRLTGLPSTIGQLTALRQLDLSSNRLTALPDTLGALVGLEELLLRDNPLTTLPEGVVRLRSLRKLWLGQTGLTALPESLFALPMLEELELRGLPIRRFPPPDAFPALRRVRVDRAREGAAHQWSRQRIQAGMPPLLVQ